ncbi:MAG: DUF2096 domain-containing protein [bacterium]|nr:DUF2096 domain-containing protein [bacterium]
MNSQKEEKKVTYELLLKYGAKWAVLAAMEVDLMKKGAEIPTAAAKGLEMSHVKISSGCFSSCDAHCDLSNIEAGLIPICANYGDEYMDQWFDLMGEAMSGNLDAKKISDIPLLEPIKSKCTFLDCTC